MERKYYKYFITAILVIAAAFTGCKEDSGVVSGNIELLAPDDNGSFNLSDLLSQNGTVTFSWTKVGDMNYTILFSPTEEGLATTSAVIYTKNSASYDLTSIAADHLIAQNTDAQPGESINLYWTIKSGDGVKSQIRKVTFKRLTEKELEEPKLELQDMTITNIAFEAIPAEAKTIDVVSNIAWSVTVNPESSWLTVVPASGSGNGTITLTAEPNDGDARTATLTISGQGIDGVADIVLTVSQKRHSVINGNPLFNPVYFNNFEKGWGEATVVGAGTLENAGGNFGTVFQNVGGAQRTNYLLLPDDVLSNSTETKELSIGVWVNATNAGASAGYMWSPLFMAYGAAPVAGANTWPMLGCQYRGVVQVNCAGWCDFTDAQNVNGVNTLYHNDADWLADHKWHYYTATFTTTTAKVYLDGVLVNAWNVSGTGDGNVIGGLFSNGGDLKYICLGGNQAWNWGDPDPGFAFDDIAIYNTELSASQIQEIIDAKMPETPAPVYQNTFESGLINCQIIGGGSLTTVPDIGFAQVFQNASGGMRQNYLLLPDDVLSHSTESKALSIAVWVNATHAGASADYMWSPLFMAYGAAPVAGANTWPMLGCQYRGVVQVNCAGWCDFTDGQNVNGVNTLYHNDADWLADHKWHYYTATFTETTAKVYFDGVLANAWNVSGTGDGNVISGLFSNGGDLKYICLGGNQAWTWGDPDPGFMFDDISIFNIELSESQIANLMSNK